MRTSQWIFGNAQADLQFMVASTAMQFMEALDAQNWSVQQRQSYLQTMFALLKQFHQAQRSGFFNTSLFPSRPDRHNRLKH